MTLTLTVTKSHIAAARKALKDHACTRATVCPLAQALNEQHPNKNGHRWLVIPSAAYIEGMAQRWRLPPEADEFMASFDYGHRVQPATFVLTSA